MHTARARALTLLLALIALIGIGAACDITGTGGGTGAVEVSVRIDGELTPGVAVTLFSVGGTDPLEQTTTGIRGTARIDGLAPGSYQIAVVVSDSIPLAGGQPEPVPFSVFGGQTVTLTFRLTGESQDNVVVVHLTEDFTFSPADVTIAPGTAVRWFNDAAVTNTVTPDGHTEWNPVTLTRAGEAFTHTFDTAGTFPYYSEPHLGDGMTGTITVAAPDGGPTP